MTKDKCSADHPDKDQETTSKLFQPLLLQAQGVVDHSLEAMAAKDSNGENMLCICTPDAAVYVTREQVKAFFGLVEPDDSPEQSVHRQAGPGDNINEQPAGGMVLEKAFTDCFKDLASG